MPLSRLEQLAYRMLGSVAEAEDVVQEARLKLLQELEPPDNEAAWLFRVVTNLSLDRLRRERRQRELYPGPWLPEPLLTESDSPAELTELAENLSLGLLLMLERLSPAERAVFVLREGFDLPFADIGELVDATPANCRQRYRRARRSLAGAPERVASADAQRELLDRLMVAVAERDLGRLVALFSEDAAVYADGGGVVSAAIRPVTDPARIAQVLLHLSAKAQREGGVEIERVYLNGSPGLILHQHGTLHSTMQIDCRDGRITNLYVMRNPHKLERLRTADSPAREDGS
jgi:RNA polymerase sigma-70 factor (ECF subfamily)